MKNPFVLVVILLLCVFMFGCVDAGNRENLKNEQPPEEGLQQTKKNDLAAVASVVEDFGGKLQAVSLQAPEDIVSKSIQENYSEFVTPELLQEWLGDTHTAPGRSLSSPWPDRIEIQSIDNLADHVYEVKGEIIEITSVEKVNGGAAVKRPVTVVVKKTGSQWLIDAVTLGSNEESNSIVNNNGAQKGDVPMQKRQQLIMFAAPSKDTIEDLTIDIYTIRADGNGLRQLTNTGTIGIAYFSPYVNKILYSVHYDAAAFHWYLMDSDGQNRQRLTDKPLAANVKWAPTQDLILYDSFNPTTEERNFILYEPIAKLTSRTQTQKANNQ